MALRHFLLAVAGAAAFSCVTHAQVVAPNYKDSTGQARSAQGMVCLTSAGSECAFGSGGGSATPTGTAGSPNAAVVTVQGITGGTPQNIAAASLPLPAGAATSALQSQISAQLPSSLGAKASAASLSLTPATDATFSAIGNVASGSADSGFPVKIGGKYNASGVTLADGQRGDVQVSTKGHLIIAGSQGVSGADSVNNAFLADVLASSGSALMSRTAMMNFNGASWDRSRTLTATDTAAGLGVNAVGVVPTSAASQALAAVSVAGASTSVLKASAGNVYGFNLVNNTTAIFAIVLDAATAPASGTALTTASIKYCFPVAASAGFDKVFSPPVRVTSGATLLASTSCTTYTTPATLPVVLIGMAQ